MTDPNKPPLIIKFPSRIEIDIKNQQSKLSKILLQPIQIKIKQYKQNQSHIYKNDTVFNLPDRNTDQYLNFLKFMNTEIEGLYKSFEANEGHTIESHLFDNGLSQESQESKNILDNYKKEYQEIYSNQLKILNETLNETLNEQSKLKQNAFQNNNGEYYPYFKKDMMSKSRRLQFEKIEKELDIKKPIQDQNDIEFLGTIVKRLEGLLNCYLINKEDTKYPKNIEYYKKELLREINQLLDLLNIDYISYQNNNNITFEKYINENILKIKAAIVNKDKPIDAKTTVKEHCKLISRSPEDLDFIESLNTKTHEELDIEIDKFKKFIDNNPIEKAFLRTFLNSECFTETNDINWENIKTKIISGDRTHRQMLFGFTKDIKKYSDFKSFYEYHSTGNIIDLDENDSNNCNYLVIWSIFMNFYYNRCSITNDDIDIPIRFNLPTNKRKIKANESINTSYKYNMRIPAMPEYTKDIFKTDNLQFIGFISIKCYHETNEEEHKIYNNNPIELYNGKFKIWYLFLFKKNKNNKEGEKYMNYMTGKYVDVPIFTHKLQFVYNGSLFARDSITYEEIKFFKNKSETNHNQDIPQLHIYMTKLDNETLFISPKQGLQDLKHLKVLGLEEVKMNISDKSDISYITERYVSFEPITPITNVVVQHNGGNNKLDLSLKYTKNINIYSNDFNSSNIYSSYINLTNKIYDIDDTKGLKLTFEYNKTLYKYILVSPKDLLYLYTIENNVFFKIIPKYNPISAKFFHYNEIFINYNILNNINKYISILNIGGITPIELLKYKNYKIKIIKNINTFKLSDYQINVLNIIKNIYNIDTISIKTNNKLYSLPNLYPELYGTFNLNIYSNNIIDKVFHIFDSFYNIINIYIGALIGLKYTALDGTFIINLNDVATKAYADIYLILKQYFKESYLYYPEITNMVKRSGVFGIFKGFKGIPKNELEILENIFEKLKKEYPNNMIQDFNIYDKELRKTFNITKPIEPIGKRYKYIDGFLNIKKNTKEYENTYREIIEFNDTTYFNRFNYVKKLLYIYENNIIENKPSNEQIISSIIYCRKYNIPFNDKYTENKLNNITGKTILNDMYGLQEPILAKFKTPFQTYITNKIILNPKLKYNNKSKSNSHTHSHSIFKTSYSSHSSRTKRNTKIQQNKYKHKRTKKQDSIGYSFFNNIFKSKSTSSKTKSTKSSKSSKSSYTPNSKTRTRTNSLFKRQNLSLDDALFDSNNSIVQVGRIIDSRKDFTKANPNEDYDNFKEQFRYYKTKGKDKQNNLNLVVQNILGDNSISQAWLKMYEIISECGIVPLNKSGTFKSFHYCEAPGTFINCLNNYVYTKSKFDKFEWMAQSLHPRLAKIKDAYGIIKRHPKNWDWGKDGTGDITNPDNIIHYSKIIKLFNMDTPHNKPYNKPHTTSNNTPFLITADAGLEPEDPKYKMVAYSSYVAILYTLPIHGTMIYKIKDTPLDLPLIWNLIYITYTNFKEMYLFKPVQNSQSREFYIIAKEYLGTNSKVLEYLIKQIDNFNKTTYEPPNTDLFDDMYPEEFVVQMKTIYEKLAANYVNSIERIIYYVDNKELIGTDYTKHIKNYIEEKNEDWIRKYKIKRLERNKIL
jgi:hypothetical protein